MIKLQIPDDVFTDLVEKAIVADKRGFVKFNQKRYIAHCTNQTKRWIDSTGYEPKFVGFFVKQNQHEIVIGDCIQCGKQLTEKDVLLGHIFCSHYCQTQSEQRKQNAKQTNIEKYGVDNPTKNAAVLQKRKQTCLEKYGAESVVQSDYFKQKSKQTLLENYGVDVPFKSEQIKQKAKQSLINNIGVDNPFKLEQYQQQARETRREKYGAEYYSQTNEHKTQLQQFYATKDDQYWEQIAEKKKQTNLERYGTEYSSSVPEIIEKIKQTNLEKYGSVNWLTSEQRRKQMRADHYDLFIKTITANRVQMIETKQQFIESDAELHFVCLDCGTQWTTHNTFNSQAIRCPSCMQHHYSNSEKQLVETIRKYYNGTVIENDRSILDGKELDIYLPDLKIAFEFNGNYWHSDAFDRMTNDYHLNKTIGCNKQGIRLIHIFEYMWNNKRQQIEYFLQNVLSDKTNVIYGRQCEVRSIDNDTYRTFVEQYHLDGYSSAPVRLGLFYNDQMIAVGGFGHSRFNEDVPELIRYCCHPNYRVVGGLNKLATHSPYDCIISYVDRATFTGSGYKDWNLIAQTKPSYVYVNCSNMVYSRYQAQKRWLPKLLGENFDPELSEPENMYANGFYRIFDKIDKFAQATDALASW